MPTGRALGDLSEQLRNGVERQFKLRFEMQIDEWNDVGGWRMVYRRRANHGAMLLVGVVSSSRCSRSESPRFDNETTEKKLKMLYRKMK